MVGRANTAVWLSILSLSAACGGIGIGNEEAIGSVQSAHHSDDSVKNGKDFTNSGGKAATWSTQG